MPIERLKIMGGVDINQPPALNSTALADSQCIRFMPDPGADCVLIQKLGGWAKYYPNQFNSYIRELWPWNDQNDQSHLGVGADEQLAVITDGSIIDITPKELSYSVPVKFETIGGSEIVTVTDGANYIYATTSATGNGVTATIGYTGSFIFPVGGSINVSGVTPTSFNGNHIVTASSAGSVSFASSATGPQTVAGTVQNESSVTAYDSVYIQTPISVGGLTLFGLYQCYPITASTYNIIARDVFGAILPATYSTITKTVTNATGTGTTATLSFVGSYLFPVGTQIVVSSVNPTAYNGTEIVTANGSTSVSYASTASAAWISGGTISDYGSVAQFSMTQGSPTVTVTFYNHGYQVGDQYPMPVATAENGLLLSGEYNVTSVLSSYQFTIQLGNNAAPAATLSASGTGTVATLTFAAGNYTFPVGSTLLVAGVSPAGYNGTYTVTASTPTSVSYANATTGVQTVAGTLWRSDTYIPQNNGNVAFQYFIGSSASSPGAGFGVGPFGGGGFGVGVAPAPATGVSIVTFDWFLDNWGSILMACPNIEGQSDYGSPIFTYNPTQNDPSATVIGTGPIKANGIFVAMPQRQLVAWGATFTGIQDHLLVAWSDIENYTVWADQPQNQAGSFRIPRGSRIVSCMQAPQQGLIWTDIAIWSMQYIGQPDIYGFNEIATGCGLIAPKARGILNGTVYWMSQSQFFKMDGNGISPLVCPVWDTVFQQLDSDNIDKIRFAANSYFGEASWFIPITGSGGENGFCVKFNTILNQWDISGAPLTRSAWTNQSILGAPIGAGTDKYIYQHEVMNGTILLNADTSPMTSNFTTGMFALSEGEFMMFVDQFRPDMQFGLYGSALSATIQFTFYVREYPEDDPVTFGPYSFTYAMKYFTPRFRGRLVQMKISSSDINSFWRTGANRYRCMPDGKF